MSNMIIIKPLTIPSISGNRGTAGSNLLTPDPKEVFSDATNTGQTINLAFDMGADVSFDTFALIGTNASASATWSLGGNTNAEGNLANTTNVFAATAMRDAAALGPPYPAFYHRAAGPLSRRYFSFNISPGASFYAGVLILGLAFKPTWNREWGSGRKIIDTSGKQRLRGGGWGISRGAKVPGYQWTFGDLTDAEVEALYALALDRGEIDPILVIEDPAATTTLAAGTHYGLFNRLDAFEREDPDLNRYALSMEEWR